MKRLPSPAPFLVLLAPAVLPQSGGTGLADALAAPDSALRAAIERYATDRRTLLRYHDVPLSESRRERMARFYGGWREELEGLDYGALDRESRIDYLLLADRLDYELRRLERERREAGEMAPLLPFAPGLVALEEARTRMEPIDPPALAQTLDSLREAVEASREALEERLDGADEDAPVAAKTVAERAARRLDQLRSTLRGWHRHYDGYDPLYTWWAAEPYEALDRELGDFADFLREELVGVDADDEDAIVGDPIGRAALLSELQRERIAYTPEELVERAEAEFAWCEAEMQRAARELGFAGDWRAALEHVKGLHVAPGEQPRLVRELALEAIDYLDERELVTIPPLCREVWRLEMMSPASQKVTPFFTGGEVIRVAFPTDGMTHEQKRMSLRSNNEHFSRATVHHELIPGHHLQGYMAARHRTHRRIFSTPFYGEGWALYWELLLWDLGFQRSAEDRVGMLFWRMHRCARIVASLGFHLEQMEPPEMIDYLVDRVGHERSAATAEVRRWVGGSYGPLYQCAYLIGGLQFRALRAELVETGRMSDREFHDAVLRQNSIPVELVRASLRGELLPRDAAPAWRF